ncbi:MAG: hypothetical protein V4665_00125 [Patescibacteria group bacterium]
MFAINQTFEEILQEFLESDEVVVTEVSFLETLFSTKASYGMEAFFPVMDTILKHELQDASPIGTECYSITPSDGLLVWRGYRDDSNHILRQEQDPISEPGFRPWEVFIVKNISEKKFAFFIYFHMDGVRFPVTKIYIAMKHGNMNFYDILPSLLQKTEV